MRRRLEALESIDLSYVRGRRKALPREGAPSHSCLSERGAEPELQHPRLVREIGVGRRLAVIRVAFVDHIRSVVRVVEQIEHLEYPLDVPVTTKRQSLLEPHVHAVDRIAQDTGTRDDCAVAAETRRADDADGATFVSQIGTEVRSAALARAEEVDAAQLHAVAHVPDAVEDGPVTLIARGADASA